MPVAEWSLMLRGPTELIRMNAVRKDLHWLPINARIEFKMLINMINVSLDLAFYQIGLNYLVELLRKKNGHNTPSSNDFLLDIHPTDLSFYMWRENKHFMKLD